MQHVSKNRRGFIMRSFHRVAAIAALSYCLCAPAMAGGDMDAASLKALHDYTLSMDKVTAMQAAMDELEKNPGIVKKTKNIGGDSKTVAEMEGRLGAVPEAMALYRKHGLSAHDVVVMPFALMDAGMVVAYPSAAAKLADRVSPSQVAFYKQHQGELKKFSWLNGGQ
jgi:hypothetical protein